MSKKELTRKTILEAYICGKITLKDASTHMEVGYRQGKRIWKKYKEEKDQGLIHKNRGKRPANAYPDSYRCQILDIYKKKYLGFGPTFASEKLAEDDELFINTETLRVWLKEEGIWTKKRKHIVYREKRQRRPSFGELLQIDGSIHQWFVGDEKHYCLLNMVDDATGTTLALLDKGETTKVLLTTLKKWIEQYGIPKAVYVDLKSVYVGTKQLKTIFDEDVLLERGFSVFEQVCRKLNIQIIRAYSPQAKGRVERKHAVFQDRFVKELNLYGIKTIDEANKHLETFLKRINKKFAKPIESVPNCHREVCSYGNLDQIICWEHKRQLRHDWTIRFRHEYFQIKKGYEQLLKPDTFIIIKKYLDGSMRIWYEGTELLHDKLIAKPELPSSSRKYYKPKGGTNPRIQSKAGKKGKAKSPWRYNLLLPGSLKKAS
jgi:transposase